MPMIQADRLTRIGAALLKAAGASDEEAAAVATGCVNANLAGHDSHGVIAIPTYIVGLTLIIIFGYVWPILPISGAAQVNLEPSFSWAYISSVIEHGTLPALTLVLVGLGGWFISMRSLVSNIVTDDHVVYAELGGVSSGKIFSQYVARNALLPQLTGLALSLGNVFGGAVITEFLFNYPGVGRLLIQGIYRGDYSLVLGVTTMSANGDVGMSSVTQVAIVDHVGDLPES